MNFSLFRYQFITDNLFKKWIKIMVMPYISSYMFYKFFIISRKKITLLSFLLLHLKLYFSFFLWIRVWNLVILLIFVYQNFVKKIHARNLANNLSRHIWGILTGISLCKAKLICIRFKYSNALTSNVIYEHDYTWRDFLGL